MANASDDLALLDALIQVAEGPSTVEVGGTLSISGLLISGRLVSRATWVKGVLRDLGEALGPDAADAIRAGWSEKVGRDLSDRPREESRPAAEWFHLRQAGIFPGASSHSSVSESKVKWWCGRRASVESFFLGLLEE